ncbi:MAG: ATP-dependent protease subunit HslV [Spirochaetaceae bacterium]|nr:ATP-dependent protease subunit HslV [Spirochaetaceae bacterium]
MELHGTTILAVRKDGHVAMAGDGQVTMNTTVLKHNARKIRTTFGGKVLCGFAGSTADAFTLFEHFEARIQEYGGDLTRSAVELAKAWRTDKILRRLEAMMLVADSTRMLLLSGTGDVVEPSEDAIAIGSGGPYAYAAAMAYLDAARRIEAQISQGGEYTAMPGYLSAREIALRSLRIAAGICIYTNDQIVVEEL